MKKRDINLVVVAHPDDEILGFGGTGPILIEKGEIVQPIILCGEVLERSNRPESIKLLEDMNKANKTLGFNTPILGNFPNLAMNTVSSIEIVKFIEEQLRKFLPKRIYTHHPNDMNKDHFFVSESTLAAAKYFQRNNLNDPIEMISFLEILSSTEWNLSNTSNIFVPNNFVDISKNIELKIKSLECYSGIMRDAPHPRSKEVLKALAALRGAQCGCKYAESFQVVYQRSFL